MNGILLLRRKLGERIGHRKIQGPCENVINRAIKGERSRLVTRVSNPCCRCDEESCKIRKQSRYGPACTGWKSGVKRTRSYYVQNPFCATSTAFSIALALLIVSSYSVAGTESATT